MTTPNRPNDVIGDVAFLRVVTRRSGRRWSASRRGLSVGGWQQVGEERTWAPVCGGRLESYSDRIVFIGTSATERVNFAQVVAMERLPAHDQRGRRFTGSVQLVVHRSSGQPIAFVLGPEAADVIDASLELWRLQHSPEAEAAKRRHADELAEAEQELAKAKGIQES